MFLAIINDTYSEVKAEEFQRNKVHLGFYIKQLLLKILQFCPVKLPNWSHKEDIKHDNAEEEDKIHEEGKDYERYIYQLINV